VTPIRTATNTALKAIRVGSGPSAIAITPNGKKAYVANCHSGTVTPIRTATKTTLKAISVGACPEAIAITPDGESAYVVARHVVTPIATATNTAGTPINAHQMIAVSYAQSIVISTDGKIAYVADALTGQVTRISTATNTALKAIPVGIGPDVIAITPDGKTVYVGLQLSHHNLVPIDTATSTVLPGLTIRGGAHGIAITR
jgi:YVTN family beta-propeller protein